jgi:hypothetical protein
MGRKPLHSNRPSPGTGTKPSQFLRIGAMPALCQPIAPLVSAQIQFSAGMRANDNAVRASGQLRA